jgi:hypothetical protein
MADGRLVPSLGTWKGEVTVKGVSNKGAFEILNSNGAWALLFGKPLLETFNAIHDYSKDTITLPHGKQWVTLENQFANKRGAIGNILANLTLDIKQLINISGDEITSPRREVLQNETCNKQTTDRMTDVTEEGMAKIEEVNEAQEQRNVHPESSAQQGEKDRWDQLWLLDPAAGTSAVHPGTEQPDIPKVFEPTLLTRKTQPHNPARVEAILDEITIGQDLTLSQREAVRQLIAEFAECFALSMSEVTTVEGASLRLDIIRKNLNSEFCMKETKFAKFVKS